MVTLLMILLILASILLIAVVFIQNPKGGGINDFGASTQIGGVQRTTDFIVKATWSLGAVVVVLSILISSNLNPYVKAKNEPPKTDQPVKGGKAPASKKP
jgi:preprotein translocase subunit SecG